MIGRNQYIGENNGITHKITIKPRLDLLSGSSKVINGD
jgi:hypothetical protein